jgi:hypothetical protein
MAGRIPYGEKDRLVLRPGTIQRLSSPGIPIHGIVGVLKEIGALLLEEAVRHVYSCEGSM